MAALFSKKSWVIRLVATVARQPTAFDGQYVRAYNPAYYRLDGTYDGGYLEVTSDVREALRFPDQGAALALWKTSHGMRPDGEPNRPLTAWSIEVIPV